MAWDLQTIRDKIERDMATEDEDFVSQTELNGYINDAIREAESEIHKLGVEDEYFLAKDTIDLVNGTASYSLPTDIYANKIRRLMYVNGTDYYPVKRIRGSKRFEKYYDLKLQASNTEEYNYILLNNEATGPMIELVPTAYEDLTDGVEIWYIRNARELVDNTDVCDIPEFISFIMDSAKVKIYEKEVGHPNLQKAIADKTASKTLMIESLTDQVPDDDNLMEQDLTHYEESV